MKLGRGRELPAGARSHPSHLCSDPGDSVLAALPMQTAQFRLNFTQVRNWPRPADAIQLSELRFYSPDGTRHQLQSVTNPMGNSPYSQRSENLMDDSTASKWYVEHACINLP